MIKAVSNYIYTVEKLRNCVKTDIQLTGLKFYRDRQLNTNAVMSQVLACETGMAVARPMALQKTSDGFKVRVRRRGLADAEVTPEPIGNVHEDALKRLHGLLSRKTTPTQLVSLARRELGL